MATPTRLTSSTLPTILLRQRPPPSAPLRRHLSSTTPKPSPSKYRPPRGNSQPNKPTTPSDPSLAAISYIPPPSNDPNQRALPAPVPHPTSLSQASTIFTSQTPRFLYSAARFLHLPLNTHTPEICLLGRSNVGKSTLINALAGADAYTARRAHGLKARGKGLAITSKTAGSTKSLNAYGIGPPSKQQRLRALEKAKAVKEEREEAGQSRGERRALRPEPPPQFRLLMVDMPGYGLGSEAEWGREIEKYLARRVMLKGAVLLLDAVAGVKEADRNVMEMLRDAEVKTAVVLTKVDKLRETQGGGRVEEVCLEVWNTLRNIEGGGMRWVEGAEKGWQNEVWVTSAGDAGVDGEGIGVVGARWAMAQMAGLVEDNRMLKPVGNAPRPTPKIVSFDQIQYAAATVERKVRMGTIKASF